MINLHVCVDVSSFTKCIKSGEADRQDRDEKHAWSCSWRYLETFHYRLLSCSWFSGQSSPSTGSPVQRGAHPHGALQGSGRLKESEQMDRMILDVFLAISSLPFFSSFITADHFLHWQPENDHLWTFYTSSSKTKWCLGRCCRASTQTERTLLKTLIEHLSSRIVLNVGSWNISVFHHQKSIFWGCYVVWPAVLWIKLHVGAVTLQ